MKKKKNYDEIHALARELILLKEQVKKQGVFIEDRELLTCPNCGLEEDVACGKNRFRCPACCAEFNAPAREEMECKLKPIANKLRRVAARVPRRAHSRCRNGKD